MTRRIIATAVGAIAAVGLSTLAAASSATPAAPGDRPAAAESPLRLQSASESATAWKVGRRVSLGLSMYLAAGSEPFELRSFRSDYHHLIQTQWMRTSGPVTLPAGLMSTFRGLPGFIQLRVRERSGELVASREVTSCLNGWGQRLRPDAPATSPYPTGCPRHPFTVGSVMGIQDGWAIHVNRWGRPLRLDAGRYHVRVAIAPMYRELFGIADADAVQAVRLRVREFGEPGGHDLRGPDGGGVPHPALHRPAGAELEDPTGPVANLRSLPADGITISGSGRFLRFGATVWNAGPSPLVVDGFRRPNEDVMDAYQYFFDADGNQVGYQQVGSMEWDPRDHHFHWHFRDFARYRLLDADKQGVLRSKKEAFCLANTDAVDYTVPNANWNPTGTDLETACGGRDSLAVREVLDVGSGDTYYQFRPGQSFNLAQVPNGIYFIAVEANPMHRLVETSTDDNVAYRKIRLGGTPSDRTVKVFPVGLIGR